MSIHVALYNLHIWTLSEVFFSEKKIKNTTAKLFKRKQKLDNKLK